MIKIRRAWNLQINSEGSCDWFKVPLTSCGSNQRLPVKSKSETQGVRVLTRTGEIPSALCRNGPENVMSLLTHGGNYHSPGFCTKVLRVKL